MDEIVALCCYTCEHRWSHRVLTAEQSAGQSDKLGSIGRTVNTPSGPVQSSPLLTVVIPAYNGADVVATALASVLDQIEDDVEVIVVDRYENALGHNGW